MTFIKLNRVSLKYKSYENNKNNFFTLKDINLSINKNDKVGIVGLNGSGKTTLLKVFSGIFDPDSGTVVVDGSISTFLNIGISFYPNETLFDNINIFSILFSEFIVDKDKFIFDVLDFSQLNEYKNHKFNKLSSGMQSRIKFSTSVFINPDILILDEWIGAGDMLFQDKATKKLKEKFNEIKIVIIASHNINLLNNITNKTIFLEDGRVVSYGPTKEVLNKYSSHYHNIKSQ